MSRAPEVKLPSQVKSPDGYFGVETLRVELQSFGDGLKESLIRDIGWMLKNLHDDLLHQQHMPPGLSGVSRSRESNASHCSSTGRLTRPSLPATALTSLHTAPGHMFISEDAGQHLEWPFASPLGSCATTPTSREDVSSSPRNKPKPFGSEPFGHGLALPHVAGLGTHSGGFGAYSHSAPHSTQPSARPSGVSDGSRHSLHSLCTIGTVGTSLTGCTEISNCSRLRTRKAYVCSRGKELERKGKRRSLINLQIHAPFAKKGAMETSRRSRALSITKVAAQLAVPDIKPLTCPGRPERVTPMERILSTNIRDSTSSEAPADADVDVEDQTTIQKNLTVEDSDADNTQDESSTVRQTKTAFLMPRHSTQSCSSSGSSVEPSPSSQSTKQRLLKSIGKRSARSGVVDGEASRAQDFLNALPEFMKAQKSEAPDTPSLCSRCTSTLVDYVESMQFDYAVGLLILLNAASIGAQTDYLAQHGTDIVPLSLRVVELIFCALFTVELILRLYVYRLFFFFMHGWKWNVFDATLVGLQIAEEAMNFIANLVTDGENSDMKDFAVMKIMRILRLVRIMRLVRVLRLVGELHTIVISICGSMKSLCWTIVLLLLLMYIVGVYFTQLVSDHMIGLAASDPDAAETQKVLSEYFGSLGGAVLTLFQAITGGLSWREVVTPMIEYISPWVSLVFGLYIAFVLFALMNIVTGVFVENALETARKDKDLMLLQQVRSLFASTDVDKSGQISWEEFEDQLDNPEMETIFEAIDLGLEEAKELFRLLDGDESGEVDCEEFVNGCFRLRGPAKAIDLATMMSDFDRMMKFHSQHHRQVEAALRWLAHQHLKKADKNGEARKSGIDVEENLDGDKLPMSPDPPNRPRPSVLNRQGTSAFALVHPDAPVVLT